MLVISFPCRVDHGGGVRVAVQREDTVRSTIEENRVRILGGRNTAQRFVCLQIEHDYGLIVAGSGEAVARGRGYCGPVRALDSGDFAEEFSGVFVHYHHTSLAGDEDPVVGWIRHDVVPASVSAQLVRVGHTVRRGGLCQQRQRGHGKEQSDLAHVCTFPAEYIPGGSNDVRHLGASALPRG